MAVPPLGLIFGVYTALVIVWIALGTGGSEVRSLAIGLSHTPLEAGGVAAACWASRRSGDHLTGRAWRLTSLALAFWLAGDVLLAFFQFLETEEPVPSLADVAYLAFYPCLAAGLLSFPGAPRDWSERRNLGLDALIALIGGTMVIWYLVVGPAVRSDEGFLAVVLGVAHPVGGFLFGGSGTVVCGAERWLADHDASDLTAVAIAPDLGERYLDTVYHTNWVQGLYGEGALSASPSSEERHAVPLG